MGGKTSLLMLRMLMVLLFSGWISLWVLKPTEMWAKKWKQAEEKATKTVFNYNGLDFAVYTLPFLAFAMVGFVYLEVKSKREVIRRPEKKLIHDLHNPLVVSRNVGILTGFEILIVSVFIAFLSWTFYAHISNDFKKLEPIKSLKLNVKWQYKFFKVATRYGLLSEACLALLLLPILRGMAIFRILGIQFEVSVRYHIWLGTTMMLFATLHGVGTFFIWGIKHTVQDKMWRWQPTGRIYLAGEIALLAGLVMWMTSLPQIRRRHFEIFYYTHHLYIIFFVFLLFHLGDRHFYMVLPGVFLFVLDKVLQFVQSWPQTFILSARVLPCKAVELILPKDPKLHYSPGSVIFIKIPHISKLQWHSFSITSSCRVDKSSLSIMIKSEGWWTSALYNLILATRDGEADQMKCLPVAVEGPYGPKSANFQRYDSLVLVAGGIGITPFLSILQEIAATPSNAKHILPEQILLIYAVKKSQDISLLNPILSLIPTGQRSCLKLNIFVTREVQSDRRTLKELLDEGFQVQTINFDTRCSRNAAQEVESLPWMTAVIGLSSVIFLVFLTCFNLYIQPLVKNHGAKVPSSVTDLLLLCSFTIAIICSSLLAIFLRLKRMRKETPPFSGVLEKTAKPSSTQRDHTLVEHEIHFGGRPDFKELFRKFTKEIRGSNVGVFVCGPESMKESVALTCKPNSPAFRVDGEKSKLSVNFHSLNFTL
ncbi:OLC1v1013209C1 [Oldenlandia corymbosa var. corymbosa]|uniref:OLC1v1013209C1 n=1 Tax=Oldenlandia corymbosa var. corymbosa TaxID=529605 RepID=A0AAV1DZS4_OLDCO|nr:OLC1v1013209C1 [Oldenlandia corymbosa var. corymbosa]